MGLLFSDKTKIEQLAYYVNPTDKENNSLCTEISKQKDMLSQEQVQELISIKKANTDKKKLSAALHSFVETQKNTDGKFEEKLKNTVQYLNRQWYIAKGTTAIVSIMSLFALCYVAYRLLSSVAIDCDLNDLDLGSATTPADAPNIQSAEALGIFRPAPTVSYYSSLQSDEILVENAVNQLPSIGSVPEAVQPALQELQSNTEAYEMAVNAYPTDSEAYRELMHGEDGIMDKMIDALGKFLEKLQEYATLSPENEHALEYIQTRNRL